MIGVAVKDTNEVLGFPEGTSIDEIENAIKSDLHGSISERSPTIPQVPGRAIEGFVRNKFPTFYDNVFAPAIKNLGPEPKFFQPKFDNTAERAFATNAASSATLLLGLIGMQYKAPDAAELASEHPVASMAGSFAGFPPALRAVSAGLKAIKYPEIAGTLFLKPLLSLYETTLKVNPTAAKAISGLPKAAADFLQSGAEVGTLALGGQVNNLLNTPENQISEKTFEDIGHAVAKDALLWGFAGSVSGSTIKPLEELNLGQMTQEAVKAATINGGIFYTISQLNGDNQKDSALGAGMAMLYTILHVAGNDFMSRKWAMEKSQKMISGYIKAKNPMAEDPVPQRAAQEYAQNVADELIKKTKELGTKFSQVPGGENAKSSGNEISAGGGQEGAQGKAEAGVHLRNNEPAGATPPKTEDVKKIVEQAGGSFKAITGMEDSIYPDEPTIYFDDANRSTKTIRPSQLSVENVQKKMRGESIPPPNPIDEVAKSKEMTSSYLEKVMGEIHGESTQKETIPTKELKKITVEDFNQQQQKLNTEDLKVDPVLIDKINQMQDILGKQLKISSGYRTQEYNQLLKSQGYNVAENSLHLSGKAADIPISKDLTHQEIVDAAHEVGLDVEHLSLTPKHVHVEIPTENTPTFKLHPKKEESQTKNIINNESGEINTEWLNGSAQAVKEAINLISPKTFVDSKALDEIYRAKGGKDKTEFELEVQMKAFRDMFDKMPQEESVEFIDRIKRGEKQKTPLLQAVADMMRKIEDSYYTQVTDLNPNAVWKENHYRVLWKVIPGTKESKRGFKGLFRRPLQGTKGFLKASSLEDMSEGLKLGGVPYSYNPMVMWQTAVMDMQSYITANRMFDAMKEMGMAKFVKFGAEVPEGFVRVNDSIARKYFKVDEGLINAGEYYIEENVGRVLNNYLSSDNIRNSAFGKSLLAFKNITTSIELSLSPFHAMYESGAAVASKIGLGLQKIVNRGDISEGLLDVMLAALAPGEFTATGGRAIKYVANKDEFIKTLEGQAFLKRFPEAEDLIKDAFMGGMKFAIHQDYKTNSIRALQDGIKAKEPWAIAINALPGLNEALMKPMFEWFIPRLKLGAFLIEMQEATMSRHRELRSGKISREELARKIVDSIENRFGEMNFDNLFWKRNFKTGLQLGLRSVTWKYGAIKNVAVAIPSQIKEIADAAKSGEKPKLDNSFGYLLGVAIMVSVLSSLIQKLFTGKWPESWKDVIAPRYDENGDRIMLNTHIKDWIHIIHSPAGFLQTSMSGEIGRMIDIWNNKDFYGTEIYHADDPKIQQAIEIAKHMFPIPFSISQFQRLQETRAPLGIKATTAVGITQPVPRYISNTPAEQEATDIIQSHREVGARTKEQFDKSNLKKQIVRDIKQTGSHELLDQAINEGKISRREGRDILKTAKMTKFESMTRSMTYEEVAKIIDKASPDERKELLGIFKKKVANKLKISDEREAKDLRKYQKLILDKYGQ